MLTKMTEIGFELVGKWALNGDRILFEIEKFAEKKDVLYSFVSNNKILYIGKTKETLTSRLNQYKNPGKTQNTNIRINEKIIKSLKNNISIDILALCKECEPYGAFFLSITAGLEDSLIREIAPKWNINL